MEIVVDQRRSCRYEPLKIGGLGRIGSPLALASINGEQKLIVSPWAAIGTDVIGLGISSTLFFSTDSTVIKIVSALGALWMLVALTAESRKLLFSDEQRLVQEEL